MPDERQESTRDGIGAAPESEMGRAAEERNRETFSNMPASTRPDGGMGGTSDVDAPVDDAEYGRAINERADRRETKR
jgi:hypothetical protein